MLEHENQTSEKKEEPQITLIEYNGKTFEIIEHFSDKQTFSDIVKNALRREFQTN